MVKETRYKTRQGVIMTEIAGEYVLVTAKALQNDCPYATQINESSAFLWKRMENGATPDELLRAVTENYELEDTASAKESIAAFLDQMQDLNYLTTVEGKDHYE